MKIYHDVIELLLNGSVDFRKLGIELAKQYPSIFLELAYAEPPEPWCREAVDFLKNGAKVNCVKAIRNATGIGLKEAVDIANNLTWEIYRKDRTFGLPNCDAPTITQDDCLRIYNKIKQVI